MFPNRIFRAAFALKANRVLSSAVQSFCSGSEGQKVMLIINNWRRKNITLASWLMSQPIELTSTETVERKVIKTSQMKVTNRIFEGKKRLLCNFRSAWLQWTEERRFAAAVLVYIYSELMCLRFYYLFKTRNKKAVFVWGTGISDSLRLLLCTACLKYYIYLDISRVI